MINGKYKSVFIIPFAISVIVKITTKQYEMIHEYLFLSYKDMDIVFQ